MFNKANKNKEKKILEVSSQDENAQQQLIDVSDPSKEEQIYDIEKEDPMFKTNKNQKDSNWVPAEFGEQVFTNTKQNDLFVEEVMEQTPEKEHVEKEEEKTLELVDDMEDDRTESPKESMNEGTSEFHEKVDGLHSLIDQQFHFVEKKLDHLSNEFELKLKYDQHKEQTIDKLHSELQVYKDNMIHERLMPVIMDLILTIDRTTKLKKSLDNDAAHEKHMKVIDGSIIDLEDTLYKQGVESYECEGSQFQSSTQKIVRTIKTDEASLDKQIAERLGKGYEWDEKVIRKEQVSVYVYEKKTDK